MSLVLIIWVYFIFSLVVILSCLLFLKWILEGIEKQRIKDLQKDADLLDFESKHLGE